MSQYNPLGQPVDPSTGKPRMLHVPYFKVVRTFHCRQRSNKDMYGLPENIDLSFFEGAILLQVCVGAHDLILNFDKDISVSIESTIAIEKKSKSGATKQLSSNQTYEDYSQAATPVAAFLDRSISSVKHDTTGTITIQFQQFGSISIFDNNKNYESYNIKRGNEEVIVV